MTKNSVPAFNQNKLNLNFYANNNPNTLEFQEALNKCENYVKQNNLDAAVLEYKKLISLYPNLPQPYLGLAKTYKLKKELDYAETNFKIYLEKKSDDVESIVLLGEVLKEKGKYSLANEQFEKALKLDPYSDYARRNLLESNNYILSSYSLDLGLYDKLSFSKQNLKKAIQIAIDYLPSDYTNDLLDVTVSLSHTDSLGGRNNIAQYEHSKRKITISKDYTYASPELLAAYLIHEFVHAKDNDSYTSIAEEQDAYRASAIFWSRNSANIKDPEMDYVVSLYSQSSKALDQKVAEIYKLRDPFISDTSPFHPPDKSKKLSAFKLFDFFFKKDNDFKTKDQLTLTSYPIIF